MADKKELTKKKIAPNMMATSVKIIIGLIGFFIFMISRSAFIFFILAIMPSITSVFIDKRIIKSASGTICAFNLMGVLPYVFNIWKSNDFDSVSQSLIVDVYVWFIIYGTTSIGCILIWILPQVTADFFQVKSTAKIAKIDQEIEKIKNLWGENVIN